MTTLGTRLFTLFKGEFVGQDEFGNHYYRERGKAHDRWERRWVIYEGDDEASKVPALWHQWLHKTVHEPPADAGSARRVWYKQHQPNRTGTDSAYRPPGHEYQGGRRAAATGDYEPWRPS